MNRPTSPIAATSTANEDPVPPSPLTSAHPIQHDDSSSSDDDNSTDGEDLYVAIVRTLLDEAESLLATTSLDSIPDPEEVEGRALLKTIVNTVAGIVSLSSARTPTKDSSDTDASDASDSLVTDTIKCCEIDRDSPLLLSATNISSTAEGYVPKLRESTTQTSSGDADNSNKCCEIHGDSPPTPNVTDISCEEGPTTELIRCGTHTTSGDTNDK